MINARLSVAVPWGLSHYILSNGFHPLYRALLEPASPEIEVCAWDNVKLHKKHRKMNETSQVSLLLKK